MRNTIGLLLIALCFLGCEKEIEEYKGTDGIYFDNKDILVDSIYVHWGLEPSEVLLDTVHLKVMLMGNTTTYARSFSIQVKEMTDNSETAQEGVDYIKFPLDYQLPANEAYAIIDITLKRTPELQHERRMLKIELQETDELSFLYSRKAQVDSATTRLLDIQRVIVMDEEFPQPSWWNSYGEKPFGKWSMKKSILICDQLNIDRKRWIAVLGSDEGLAPGYLTFAGKYMNKWLKENPTYEDDGKLMEMGSGSK